MIMKRGRRCLCRVTLLVAVTVWPGFAAGQKQAPKGSQKLPEQVLAFLKQMKPKATFTGEVINLPNDLRETLERAFYLHRFNIVRMSRHLGISRRESELLVVTDAKSGKVVSVLWELGVGDTPESFKELLTHYEETYDWRGAAACVKFLSDLLVYPDRDYGELKGGRVGSIRYDRKGKAIEVELIRVYRPYRLLRVVVEETDDRYKFGRLSIIDAETGREQ